MSSIADTPDHILVVDDDREIRTLLAEYLEKQGLRCTVVADGRQMRAALEKGRFDLVVLDLMLPGISGIETARAIRTMTVTCLLYTSPSPRDRQKSRMPSSA